MALRSHGKPSSENDDVPIHKVTGYLEVDVNVDIDRLLKRMKDVGVDEPGHPMMLPAIFFEDHVRKSSENFVKVAKDISNVENFLRNGIGTSGEGYKDPEYGVLSRTLDRCTQALEELKRRMHFEMHMANILTKSIPPECSKLKQQIQLFAEMSKNRDLDIQFLPKRIESQLTLVR
jgi:hypothetical protein